MTQGHETQQNAVVYYDTKNSVIHTLRQEYQEKFQKESQNVKNIMHCVVIMNQLVKGNLTVDHCHNMEDMTKDFKKKYLRDQNSINPRSKSWLSNRRIYF